MTTLGLITFGVFVLLSLGQLALVYRYLNYVVRYRTPDVSDADLPRAAIVMALRGTDPFIGQCLERLATQRYPRYEVYLVVDSPADAAMEAVAKWRLAHPKLPVTIDFLHEPGRDCTLYCSSLHQAVSSLGPEIEIVAFANADTMPHAEWLRSLAAPLTQVGVGVVTGNRWYLPQSGNWGTLVRYVQNASAIVGMQFLGLLWGGSLALKRAVFTHPLFLHRLRNACCEDHAVLETLRASGERVVFTPAVLMVNQEDCSLASGFRFLRRQLGWTRIYHPRWNELLVHAAGLAAVVLATVVGLCWSLAAGDWRTLGWISAGVTVCYLANVFTLWWTHRTIMRRVRSEQGEAGELPLRLLPKLLVALPLTLYVHLGAIFSAAWIRRVEWRGIHYVVVPPRGIKLVAYHPYQRTASTVQENLSL